MAKTTKKQPKKNSSLLDRLPSLAVYDDDEVPEVSFPEDFQPEPPPLAEYDDEGMFKFEFDPWANDFVEVKPVPTAADKSTPKNPEKSSKKSLKKEPLDKSNMLFELSLTRTQLVHLRDLFSTLLSFDDDVTLSAALAEKEGHAVAESRLWDKIHQLCGTANIPVDETAPDFVVGLAKNPELGLFTLEPDDLEESEE